MAFSLSPRENYLNCLNFKPTEYTPGPGDAAMVGGFVPWERGEGGAGIDAFGVRWVSPPSAAMGALPAPDEFVLTDITQWRSVVQFTDPKDFDWEGVSQAELANVNRDMQVVEVGNLNFIYERLATLMGFEGALLAMALEPEATYELLSALLDWKIELLQYYSKYYQPDVYTYFDDVATERVLFMSPETYQTLLKPLHTKMCSACKELGIIPIQHTCGKGDLIVQDMIDEGNHGWSAVQATNDIEDIIEQHRHEFVIIGGYNSNGAPGQLDATTDMVRAEVRRCVDTYGKYQQGYVFSGMIVTPGSMSEAFVPHPLNLAIADEFQQIRAEQEALA